MVQKSPSIHTDQPVIQIKPAISFEEVGLLEIRLRGGDLLLFDSFYRSPTTTSTSEKNNGDLNRLLRFISENNYSHKCYAGDFNFRDVNCESWSTNHNEDSNEIKWESWSTNHNEVSKEINWESWSTNHNEVSKEIKWESWSTNHNEVSKDIKWESWSTNHNEDSKENKFIETIRDCYLHQHLQLPTRRRGNDEPSLIDLLLTDEIMQVWISHIMRHLVKVSTAK